MATISMRMNTNLEHEVIETLKDNKVRPYLILGVSLLKKDYDPEKLVEIARENNVYHKLGYMVETIYTLVQKTIDAADITERISGALAKMKVIINSYSGPAKPEIHLLAETNPFVIHEDFKSRSDLNKKWGIIGQFSDNELLDYLRFKYDMI